MCNSVFCNNTEEMNIVICIICLLNIFDIKREKRFYYFSSGTDMISGITIFYSSCGFILLGHSGNVCYREILQMLINYTFVACKVLRTLHLLLVLL